MLPLESRWVSFLRSVVSSEMVCGGRLMPAAFRDELLRRDYQLVEVPGEEFDSMGTNVLALAPRVCVMVKGNPKTRIRRGAHIPDGRQQQGDEHDICGARGSTGRSQERGPFPSAREHESGEGE